MRTVKVMLALCVALIGAAHVHGADNKELIVGKWEASKVEENSPLPKGALLEFTADGKMSITLKKGDDTVVRKGTYTVDGDSFTVVFKKDDADDKHKISIKKLTKEELEAANEKGQVILFKKVK